MKDQAEIARAAGITRARVTQILNLTNLAPDIQHAVLDLERSVVTGPEAVDELEGAQNINRGT